LHLENRCIVNSSKQGNMGKYEGRGDMPKEESRGEGLN